MLAVLSWSGGRESVLALQKMLKDPSHRLRGLLSTINEEYDRVSLHGVRRTLPEMRAQALRLPIYEVLLSKHASDEEYAGKMRRVITRLRGEGVSSVIFGDIFLEDVRRYRERRLSKIGVEGLFPLWGQDTRRLAEHFIAQGFKAVITCVDTEVLPEDFLGRRFDQRLLHHLSSKADPCGENGEFHTFVFDGPLFDSEIPYFLGETVSRGRFSFIDLIPCKSWEKNSSLRGKGDDELPDDDSM